MKKILLLILVISMTNCKNDNNNIADANYQVEKDIKRYISLWDIFLQNRDTSVINSEYFTEDCIVVTAQGNIVGIEAVKAYYTNYLNGFTEIEWEIKETFGQGNKLITTFIICKRYLTSLRKLKET